MTVHPRIRGERISRLTIASSSAGSSPHTRGTRTVFAVIHDISRFIPAYAGNAAVSVGLDAARSVHPRIRGERVFIALHRVAHFGSSPHTRGTRANMRPCRSMSRFIPAYAGNARMGGTARPPRTVHPRIRGERRMLSENDSVSSGSSPHTRGTLRDGDALCLDFRFIPAYAGNAG